MVDSTPARIAYFACQPVVFCSVRAASWAWSALIGATLIGATVVPVPEIFPTRLRALGVGIGNGAGRLATFGSSFGIENGARGGIDTRVMAGGSTDRHGGSAGPLQSHST
jgi:hypothetical protein